LEKYSIYELKFLKIDLDLLLLKKLQLFILIILLFFRVLSFLKCSTLKELKDNIYIKSFADFFQPDSIVNTNHELKKEVAYFIFKYIK